MHFSLSLKTSLFDLSKEEENPINPIYGKSLLEWLRHELSGSIELIEPDAEDWGWYSELNWKGRNYLIGSSAYFKEGDDPTSEIEYIFQVDKHRTFKEVMLGREKMTPDDECFQFFKSFFENNPSFKEVSVE